MRAPRKSIAVLIFTLFFLIAAVYGIKENETIRDETDLTIAPSFSPDLRITVETEKKTTSRTMTDAYGQDGEISQGRTFALKRLQLMLLPLMYKMGVMSTLLVVLVVVSLKSLLIGIILLVVKVAGFLAKFHHAEPQQHASWSPPVQPWPLQPQPIYLHISHSNDGHHGHHVQDQVYPGWDRSPQTASIYPQVDPYGAPTSPGAMDHLGQYYFKG